MMITATPEGSDVIQTFGTLHTVELGLAAEVRH